MLGFTDDEKAKVAAAVKSRSRGGLLRSLRGSEPGSGLPGSSLADSWVDFLVQAAELEGGDDAAPAAAQSPAGTAMAGAWPTSAAAAQPGPAFGTGWGEAASSQQHSTPTWVPTAAAQPFGTESAGHAQHTHASAAGAWAQQASAIMGTGAPPTSFPGQAPLL